MSPNHSLGAFRQHIAPFLERMQQRNLSELSIDAYRRDLQQLCSLLAEKLAENAHDVWARQRMEQGWTYGPERDDLRKKHPCLIPYQQLPESEKVYDRKVSMETLKLILSEGYDITPKKK